MNSDQFTATAPKFHCDLRLGTLDGGPKSEDFRLRTTTLDVGARRGEGGDASKRRDTAMQKRVDPIFMDLMVSKQSKPEPIRDCARRLPIRIFATVKGVNTTANQPVRTDGLGRNLVDSAFFRRP